MDEMEDKEFVELAFRLSGEAVSSNEQLSHIKVGSTIIICMK